MTGYPDDQPTIELGPPGYRYEIYDPGGGGRVATILRSGVPYEVDVVEDIHSLGLTGVAVDAGANIGNHSLWLAAVCGLRVEAFEPIKLPKLRANIALNHFEDRIVVHPFALGAQRTSATARRKNRLDVTVDGSIEVRRLDEFDLTDVAVIKIDVEGMETDVIRGGVETIGRELPTIYTEAWDPSYLAAVRDLLEPFGYTYGRRFRWHQHRWDPPT